MLTAIAIDDEPIALDVVKNLAVNIPFLSVKEFFTNAFKAAEFLRKEKVDLIFLDIKMPDISGIDFLRSLPNPPMIIFTTAYSEHAVLSFELDVIDYLLKPFSLPRFLKACNKAYEQYELKRNNHNPGSPASVFIKSGYGQVRVELDDILYVESIGNYVQFISENHKIVSRQTMTEVEGLLPAASFVRVHRSFIVSKKKVSKIEKNTVWIKQAEIPVGSSYTVNLEKLLE